MSQLKASRTGLLKAKDRDWQTKSSYKEIFVVPTRKKHDSGWMCMAIVGVLPNGKYEKAAAYCDDIGWLFKTTSTYSSMRNDCTYPGGILHYWDATFEVGTALSSVTITVMDQVREPALSPSR